MIRRKKNSLNTERHQSMYSPQTIRTSSPTLCPNKLRQTSTNLELHPLEFFSQRNVGEIRFDRERRIVVIALLRLLRLFVHRSLSRSIDGSKAHGCNTLAMIYFFPKEKCSRAGAIDASINYRASTILYECA